MPQKRENAEGPAQGREIQQATVSLLRACHPLGCRPLFCSFASGSNEIGKELPVSFEMRLNKTAAIPLQQERSNTGQRRSIENYKLRKGPRGYRL